MLSDEFIFRSREVLRQIEEQIGQTIGLGVLEQGTGSGIVMAEAAGTSGFAYHLEANYRFPIHTSAPGKAMLAYLSLQERAEYYSNMDFHCYTPGTIVTPGDFDAELESVVQKGYSIDVSEQLEGCHCIGVPVFDAEHRAVASVWTTGPSSHLPVRCFEQVADVLKKGAQELSLRLSTTSRSSTREAIYSVVDQACEIMENNLQQPIDVRQLADNLYVSYSWFRKMFREKTGCSPAAYHQQLRLEQAQKLLCETDLPVRQISERLGFKTQNHFSALFKRKTGLSPSESRKKAYPRKIHGHA